MTGSGKGNGGTCRKETPPPRLPGSLCAGRVSLSPLGQNRPGGAKQQEEQVEKSPHHHYCPRDFGFHISGGSMVKRPFSGLLFVKRPHCSGREGGTVLLRRGAKDGSRNSIRTLKLMGLNCGSVRGRVCSPRHWLSGEGTALARARVVWTLAFQTSCIVCSGLYGNGSGGGGGDFQPWVG